MTKRLSPERIAYLRAECVLPPSRELFEHIDAIEAELKEPTRDEKLAADWAWVNAKLQTAEKELAEAKAEIARLKDELEECREQLMETV